MALSRSQIDKLGDRLRDADLASKGDLALLAEVRAAYDDVLARVAEMLRDEGLEPTTRLKTVGTIIEKLQRERTMRLSRMQDIAGARLVCETRVEQDELTRRLTALFDVTGVDDRRERPSAGYRAVHVIVRVGACDVEIQVRTVLQDVWAQISERLGDRWGRDIRYGGPPKDPERFVAMGRSRLGVVELLQEMSDLVDQTEQFHRDLAIAPLDVTTRDQLEALLADAQRVLVDLLTMSDEWE